MKRLESDFNFTFWSRRALCLPPSGRLDSLCLQKGNNRLKPKFRWTKPQKDHVLPAGCVELSLKETSDPKRDGASVTARERGAVATAVGPTPALINPPGSTLICSRVRPQSMV